MLQSHVNWWIFLLVFNQYFIIMYVKMWLRGVKGYMNELKEQKTMANCACTEVPHSVAQRQITNTNTSVQFKKQAEQSYPEPTQRAHQHWCSLFCMLWGNRSRQ